MSSTSLNAAAPEDARAPDRVAPLTSVPRSLRWLLPAVIVAGTLAAFWPCLENGFVSWDLWREIDDFHGLDWPRVRWMFSTWREGHYQPLTWLSFAINYCLCGVQPRCFHLTNLSLHALNAVLLYLLVLRLLARAAPRHAPPSGPLPHVAAALAALVFAVHPLRVESVAWATERRDVLSGFFYLLTLLAYLRMQAAAGRSYRLWLCISVGLFVLALLSKVMSVSLPAVLLVLDFFPLRRLSLVDLTGARARAVLLEKMPFVLLAVIFGAIAPLAQVHVGAAVGLDEYGVGPRLTQMAYGLTFYLRKTVLPTGLSPLYELEHGRVRLTEGPFLLSALAVAGLTVVLVGLRRRWPAGLAAGACYTMILAPVSGLGQNGPQITADRYSYLACMTVAVLVAGGLHRVERQWFHWGRRAVLARLLLAGAVIGTAALGTLTWPQVRHWRDSLSFWSRVVAVEPHSVIGRYNLGNLWARQGNMSEAIRQYRIALRGGASSERASVLHRVRVNLANALIRTGRFEEAIHHLEFVRAHDPNRAEAHFNLGAALMAQQRYIEAAASYRQALRSDPTSQEARFNLGVALMSGRRYREALAELQAIDPSSAHYLAAMNNAAWVLATCEDPAVRDPDRAVDLAETVCRADGHRSAQALRVLAAAYAGAGRFEEALAVARRALDQALKDGQDGLAAELNQAIERYTRRVADHEPAR